MRDDHEPAEVVPEDEGIDLVPVRVTAWGKTLVVQEIVEPYWESLLPWWEPQNASKPLEDLTACHFLCDPVAGSVPMCWSWSSGTGAGSSRAWRTNCAAHDDPMNYNRQPGP
ncbi:hypothetical protein Psi02_69470 [Planotetraspora silvatica]|uniref:Uncharacterized protein n=2 Tax=Planotetraspora silvatica TaxID=234614 RepID=A0A8J3XVE9_9ACTN|nr:hypothetical protein Psi02_69470 [Planotetraspora silvatica]